VTLPTFLVIGALKAGTTSLWTYLRGHPDVYMPEEKELRFFVEQHNWDRGLDWYEGRFSASGGAHAIGEASPAYTIATSFPGVPARIASLIPEAKLIYVVRHPVERMRSHYLQRRVDGTERLPPERAFLEDLDYLHTSRYAFQIDLYLEHFARDQILIITTEELREDRLETLQRAFGFIGVDPDVVPAGIDEVRNRSAEKEIRSPVVAGIRERSAYRAAARVVPTPLRRLHHRLSTRYMSISDVRLPVDVEARIVDALRPDVERLRALMDPGFDGWGIL